MSQEEDDGRKAEVDGDKTLEDATTTITDESSFVDYVEPPKPSVRPPPKYKSWLVVLVLVYLTSWVVSLSGLFGFLRNTLRLSPNSATFLQLCLIVFTLLFAGMDVAVFLLKVPWRNGQWYGLGTWMANTTRVRWVHEYSNVVVETLAIIITVLEDGFSMFDSPPQVAKENSHGSNNSSATPTHFDCPNGNCKVLLKIEYKIRSDQLDRYTSWRKELERAMDLSSRPGLLNVDHHSYPVEDDTTTKGKTSVPSFLQQRVYLTFESIDYLNEYMTSPVRERLMRRLRPLLQSELLQVVAQQNAFTDLVGQQGHDSPARHPPKWKVWWITVLALYVTILFLNATTPHYFDAWGLTGTHGRVQSLVSTFFTTFVSSYVATPFITREFSYWMQRPPSIMAKHEPWRTLDDGFSSILVKMAVVIVFYGACLTAYLMKD